MRKGKPGDDWRTIKPLLDRPYIDQDANARKGAAMTLEKAIEILSLAANGHAFTTGSDFWDALRIGIQALIQQRERSSHD